MNRNEMMNLINDLALAALNYDLAKSNLEKWEKMYEELLEQFNNNIEQVDEGMLSDNEFVKKVERIKDIFDSLENEK